MYLNEDEVQTIFGKADAVCYYCKKKLAFENRGKRGAWGAWEVDHKIPRAHGGSDELSNLTAACFTCNRDKSDQSAITYRRLTKPLRVERESIAIANEMEAMAFPLVSMTTAGLLDIFTWWDERKRTREAGVNKPVKLKDLPWLGIGLVAATAVIIYMIFKAHRGT